MKDYQPAILFPYEPSELLEQIRLLIRAELQHQQKQPVSYQTSGLTQKPIYKAHEVCKMLAVSRQTLHQWAKEGLLKPYKIKSRVFYLMSDIEALIHTKIA